MSFIKNIYIYINEKEKCYGNLEKQMCNLDISQS